MIVLKLIYIFILEVKENTFLAWITVTFIWGQWSRWQSILTYDGECMCVYHRIDLFKPYSYTMSFKASSNIIVVVITLYGSILYKPGVNHKFVLCTIRENFKLNEVWILNDAQLNCILLAFDTPQGVINWLERLFLS